MFAYSPVREESLVNNINHEEVKHDSQSELVAGPDHNCP